MRVTDSPLDLASSRAYTATLEAHRQVAAWDQTGRVELTDDVTITLGSAEAAVQLGATAQGLVSGRGFGPGLGRSMGLGNGFGNGLAPGTANLVRDLNGNGVVDGGSEMFGPATQDGFGELAALDSDGSGCVDEGDAAFAQLSLWNGQEGSSLTSLTQAGVGALATRNLATRYTYGASTGTLAASSIFLYEDGRTGFTGELELYA